MLVLVMIILAALLALPAVSNADWSWDDVSFWNVLPNRMRPEERRTGPTRTATRTRLPIGADQNDYLEGRTPEAAGEIRFQKQCFLSFNMKRIHEKLNYAMVYPFYYTSLGGAPPADITALFTSRPDIQDLLNVKPYLLSYFMPSVRVYKVFGPDETRISRPATNNTEAASTAAAAGLSQTERNTTENSEVEFLFDNNIRKEAIEEIMASKKGRAGGDGLSKLNWSFLGVNPAEVENNVKLNLGIFFNDINEFEREREDPNNPGLKYRFSDLLIHEPLRRVNASDPGFSRIQNLYNPNYFRIKVVAGWTFLPSMPGNEGILDELSSNDIVDVEKIARLVYLSRKVMYLNLIRHNLDFNQDGTVEVEAEYQALVEGAFSAPNSDILNVMEGKSTSAAQDQVENTSNLIRRISDVRSSRCQSAFHDDLLSMQEAHGVDLTELRDVLTNRRSEEQAQLLSFQSQDRGRAYQRIIERLMLSGKIWRVEVPMESLGFAEGYAGAAPLDPETGQPTGELIDPANVSVPVQAAYAEAQESLNQDRTENLDAIDAATLRRMIAVSRFYQTDNFTIGQDINPRQTAVPQRPDPRELRDPTNPFNYRGFGAGIVDQPILNLTSGTGFSNEQFRTATESARALVELGNYSQGSRTIPIEFMFFGDILDTIMAPISGWLNESNIEVILGTFLYNDPSNPAADPINVRLADIPVSTELFSIWFLEEVIEKKKTKMTLRYFIRSVFNKLLINAFGGDCVYEPGGDFKLAQEGLTVMPEFYTVLEERLSQAGLYGTSIPLLDVVARTAFYRNVVSSIRNPNRPIGLLDNIPGSQFSDYINVVVYQDQTTDRNVGSLFERDIGSDGYLETAREDAEQGVYHLNIGSDRGLVKSINFNRIDQQYLVEARMESSGELNQLDQLRMRYNATVTMYGNTFFYPGQHIFINPSMVGVNSVARADALTTKLGIGGYFVITKVENIIESGLFETILTCSWVYSGFNSGGSGTSTCPRDTTTLSNDFQLIQGIYEEGRRQFEQAAREQERERQRNQIRQDDALQRERRNDAIGDAFAGG